MERRSQNSLVLQSLQELASSFFLDLLRHHPHLKKPLLRDQITLVERSNHEGVGFLTCTLPTIGKSLILALENGTFSCPTGFKKVKGTALPRFLGGLLTQVFEDDGKLKQDYDHCVLNDVIQLCYIFYKLELPYSQRCEQTVINNFKEVEDELGQLSFSHDELLEEASVLIQKVLKGFNPKEITPGHGPGGVATREKGAKKWTFDTKYNALHRVYPYYEYFTSSRAELLASIPQYRARKTYESGCARVVLVPKDSRGPRLISMEPLAYQFIQQGIAKNLVEQLESKSPLTRKRVNFTDQNINRSLARTHSLKREYSTLDMKEASDRVTVRLVQHLFSKRRDVVTALLATRTTHTMLPDGEIVFLNKFAPMGSALCFPVEALVFWTLAEVIRRREGIKGSVYVYGDDIVVPKRLTPFLFKLFPTYGLKFNENKCFTSGYFRESCGMDAYKGVQCTPIRMRHLLPESRKQASLIASAVAFSNHLWERGFWNAADYVKTSCERCLPIRVLRSPKVSFGGLAYVSFTVKTTYSKNVRVRFRKRFQRHEVLCPSVQAVQKDGKWNGSERLFASLTGRYDRRVSVPHAESLKMRWLPLLAGVA